jgi:parallel beta-helix repeat protein
MRASLRRASALLLLLYVSGPLAQGSADAEFRKQLQVQLIKAKPGDVIDLPAGKWSLGRPLSINRPGITLRGAGPTETVLSFRKQLQGGEALTIGAVAGVTIENLAIEDPKGDGIKAKGCNELTLRNVRIEWTRGPSEKNGGYGLYPVQCERVLIERSSVIGASDAGIYVGQSRDIVVRDNRVELNVVGIEIENSTNADVYRNQVTKNTGGILVINMPNLPVKFSRSTRVFENDIHANNTENFAPRGNVIARVPAGTGFMIIASDEVEFFNNVVADNQSANAMVVSFAATGKPANDFGYDPYPQRVWIHHNRFSGGGDDPDRENMPALRLSRIANKGTLPDILWDGVTPRDPDAPGAQLCISDNQDADFANIDLRGSQTKYSSDISPHQCALSALAPVTWVDTPSTARLH